VAQGLHATTLRLTTVYGPRDRGLVGTWARALRTGRPPYLPGDGSAVRDRGHGDDVVDAGAARRALGWEATTRLTEGLARTFQA
jgi:nucleoside-diphosphate-sugar epimerase